MRIDYEQGQHLVETHYCGEPDCGGELVLVWLQDHYDVHCPKHLDSEAFQPRLSHTKARRQGLPIDPYAEQSIKAKEKRRMSEQPESTALQVVEATTMQPLAGAKRTAILNWAKTVGLRPELGHVMAYMGNAYPTVDGLIYHARSQDRELRFTLTHLNIEERRAIGLDNPDYAVKCVVYNGQGKPLAERLGIVRASEVTQKSATDASKLRFPVVAAKPIEMAENRAMWDAFMDAYPLGLGPRPPSSDKGTLRNDIAGLEPGDKAGVIDQEEEVHGTETR